MSPTTPLELVARMMRGRGDPEHAETLRRAAEAGWVNRFGYDADVLLELADITATDGPYEAARRKFGDTE